MGYTEGCRLAAESLLIREASHIDFEERPYEQRPEERPYGVSRGQNRYVTLP